MFKHILLATDGSPASRAMVGKCMRLASETGACVTGIHVLPPMHNIGMQTAMLRDNRAEEQEHNVEMARRYLHEVLEAARGYGVTCDTLYVVHEQPYEAIIEHAKLYGCDLICVGSHGRKGARSFLLGGETQKILTFSPVPVLVYR
ncbi:universal stress protein [Duganella sp. LX20W]|uniref:Universal stress protein n=1 Tax=Rugamonas brunnea TaxID=2758569 RepID=A0A7W2EUD9_9BURK|nr:universal stress protein [Rugamonas brunnea]MBA5638813.1 universal stress protein [Rugamonas brunnea]